MMVSSYFMCIPQMTIEGWYKQEEFEKQKAAITKESNRDRTSAARFTTQGDNMEETLKLSTIGLRHLNDFQEVRKELEEQKAREAAKTLEVK